MIFFSNLNFLNFLSLLIPLFNYVKNNPKDNSYQTITIIAEISFMPSKQQQHCGSSSSIPLMVEKVKQEKNLLNCCCFKGFMKHKYLLCICITMILISLAVIAVISMTIMVLISMVYGNKQEEISQLMKIKISNRLLSNAEILEVIHSEKKLQIVS
jgi:hypothetical protein